jgi:Uma2 family endonuclease
MAATTHLFTVDEFRSLPEDHGDVYFELRHGEIVLVVRPKLKHAHIQIHVRDLLNALAPPGSYISIEVAFRALPEYDLRIADIAYVSAERMALADSEDNIRGAPDLVIEVLSPSNKASEMYEREQLCLENGAQEFWVLDQDRRTIRVSTADGRIHTYRSGDEIVLALFGGAKLAVDTIFDWKRRRA